MKAYKQRVSDGLLRWSLCRSYRLFETLMPFSHLAPSLQGYRQDNQRNAAIKCHIQFLVFLEDEHGKDDAVDGFQIIGQVDGEGRNHLQDNDLQQT